MPAIGVASMGPVALKSGFSWTRIYCTPGTIGYREKTERSDNGRTYEYDIKGFSPDDNAGKRQALQGVVTYDQVLCRFCDNARLLRIAGSDLEPLTFSFDLGTDTDVPGQRGYAVLLQGTTTQPALYE